MAAGWGFFLTPQPPADAAGSSIPLRWRTVTSPSNFANYQGLRLLLHPAQAGSHAYVLALQNAGQLELWHVRLELEQVIGPGAFGFDDTHMQREAHADRIEVPHIAAGAIHHLRSAARSDIAGPKVAGVPVPVTFSVRPDGEARYGQRVVLEEATMADNMR